MNPIEYRIMFEQEDTHAWYVGLRWMLNFVLRKVQTNYSLGSQPSSLMILDVGCGTGATLQFLERRGVSFGIDFSPVAISYCRKRRQTRTAVASAMQLPFPSETFDAVVCLDVLCHQAIGDKRAPLREIYRVLKKGGVAVFNLPAFQALYSSHDVQVHTDRRFTRKEVQDLLVAENLECLYATYWNTLLLPALIGQRIFRKRFPANQSDILPSSGPMLSHVIRAALFLERILLHFSRLPVGLSIMVAAGKRF